jgi:hypothetical protein
MPHVLSPFGVMLLSCRISLTSFTLGDRPRPACKACVRWTGWIRVLLGTLRVASDRVSVTSCPDAHGRSLPVSRVVTVRAYLSDCLFRFQMRRLTYGVPFLLHLAVFLFFCALGELLYPINVPVGATARYCLVVDRDWLAQEAQDTGIVGPITAQLNSLLY